MKPLTGADSIRESIADAFTVCDVVAQQLTDELLLRSVERAVDVLKGAVAARRRIWVGGDGSCHNLGANVVYRLSTPVGQDEHATRASMLGANSGTMTARRGREGPETALSYELGVEARCGDCLWIFTTNPSSDFLLNLAERASRPDLKLPVVVFTPAPGTPLVRFATAKVCLQTPENGHVHNCVELAYALLANIVCRDLRRFAKEAERSANAAAKTPGR